MYNSSAGTFAAPPSGLFVGHPPLGRGMAPCRGWLRTLCPGVDTHTPKKKKSTKCTAQSTSPAMKKSLCHTLIDMSSQKSTTPHFDGMISTLCYFTHVTQSRHIFPRRVMRSKPFKSKAKWHSTPPKAIPGMPLFHTNLTDGPSIIQNLLECPPKQGFGVIKASHKRVKQECPSRVPHTTHKSVAQERPGTGASFRRVFNTV